MTYIPTALRRQVIERASNRCEYCRLPADIAFFPHEVDHVIAEKHGGMTSIDKPSPAGGVTGTKGVTSPPSTHRRKPSVRYSIHARRFGRSTLLMKENGLSA